MISPNLLIVFHMTLQLHMTLLHAYGFLIESLKILNSYLTKRMQMVKMINEAHGWIS